MREVCELLNNNNQRTIKDWRSVAVRLEIPYEKYDTFDPPKRSSPTKTLLEWVKSDQDLKKVYDLLDHLQKIERNDCWEFLLEKRDKYITVLRNRRRQQEQNCGDQGNLYRRATYL